MSSFGLLVVGASLFVGGCGPNIAGLVLLARRVPVGPSWLVETRQP